MYNISSSHTTSSGINSNCFASHLRQLHIPQIISSTTHHTLQTKIIPLKSNENVIPSRYISPLLTGQREHLSFGGHVYVKCSNLDEMFTWSELNFHSRNDEDTMMENHSRILCSIYQCVMHSKKYRCKAQIRFYPSIHTYVHVHSHGNHPMPSPQFVMTLEDEENEEFFQNLSHHEEEANTSHSTSSMIELLYSTKTLSQVYKNPIYTKTKRSSEFLKTFLTIPNVLLQFSSPEQFHYIEQLTDRDHLYVDGPLELFTPDTRFMFIFFVRKEGSLNTIPCLYSFLNEISDSSYKTLFGNLEMFMMKPLGVENYLEHKKQRGRLQISCDFDPSMRSALNLVFKTVDVVGNENVLVSAVERFIEAQDQVPSSSDVSCSNVLKAFPEIRMSFFEDLKKLSKLTQRDLFLRKRYEFELKWSHLVGNEVMNFLREYFFGFEGEFSVMNSQSDPSNDYGSKKRTSVYEPHTWSCAFNPNIAEWNVTSDHVVLHNQLFFQLFSVNELNERFTTWHELIDLLKELEFKLFKEPLEFSQNPLHVLKCVSELVENCKTRHVLH
ncbi:hypothetical protein C9374_010622 [Naegleria lovaniensis]|uniref:Uncharacterized protein n=1 Tax=Naegleria lovaniensis TaxID=51637 RepID=A0AA88GG74_NAELO|nr:uncharacterized protein C9374_010622 [Naegleria lovaniensis]KAG2374603.1 hypothetical protein C9374_010622 [Naegleria lovaniensis]